MDFAYGSFSKGSLAVGVEWINEVTVLHAHTIECAYFIVW